jgi:hypothetical protein
MDEALSTGADMRPRLSIAALMLLVMFMAIALAALRNPARLWASGLFSLALINFSLPSILSLTCHGRDRRLWLGLALSGFIYFPFAFQAAPNYPGEPLGYPQVLSGALLDWLALKMYQTPAYMNNTSAVSVDDLLKIVDMHHSVTISPGAMDYRAYRQTVHSCAAIIFGLVGAIVGFAYVPQRPESQIPKTHDSDWMLGMISERAEQCGTGKPVS